MTSFSEALRIELREHGIRVLALCPEAAWPKARPGDALALWVSAGCLGNLLLGRAPEWLRAGRAARPAPPVTPAAAVMEAQSAD